MIKDKGKTTYTLTIEYDQKEDRCEYIQERLVSERGNNTFEIGEIDLEDYFSETDIACLAEYNIGRA